MYLGGLNIDDRETPPCCPVILAGSESDKRDEIIDRVGWLKESFDRYSQGTWGWGCLPKRHSKNMRNMVIPAGYLQDYDMFD